jgi:Periplasmic binding protein
VADTSGRLRVGACLSLSGRFSPFGRQAARGLEVWAALDGNAEVLIEDDASDVRQLQALLPAVAARCDLLLGPYSTLLMRAAGDMAADNGWLIWNHGGSGDDVQIAHPGHVVSVLTPTSRYMEPFLNYLTAEAGTDKELRIAHGKGRFGLQVACGAEAYAQQLGVHHVRIGPADEILAEDLPDQWTLISAGTFEDDAQTVIRARALAKPPRTMCAVAAGVQEFGRTVERPDGTFGIAQWFPGGSSVVLVGPEESSFLGAYERTGAEKPGYPATQAVAAASIALHCLRATGSANRDLLWSTAVELVTRTLYGTFRVDQVTGAQVDHRTVLTNWLQSQLVPLRPGLFSPESTR